ncbi:acyl-CoA N-acyltransferase [Dendryphion nanum]|uniref:Acyl-CoA N-acyltransferase n=1 Tax=Dendryphion nanum TaxID=256645 RepID=A0A9P9D9P5_9PLEO|nr:acyl-CoA N-acyltransferase [Dendryphion nanum]
MTPSVAPAVPNGAPLPAKPSKANANAQRSVDPNVLEVGFGNLLVKPWYPSFYPEELVGRTIDRLYVCQWCFKYSKELIKFLGHLKVCPCRTSPPGEKVYSKGGYSLYEIDGEECKLYAQNLSLFAKLFLDTKSVFYDVTTFLYYVLVAHAPSPDITLPDLLNSNHNGGIMDAPPVPDSNPQPPQQPQAQVVGFFSKEKMSWDNNNLACILVFPPWQKQGLGQILMGASYEMSKKEGRLGGPEKPLSELGRRAYIHYWSQTIARAILSAPSKKALTVLDLCNETYIVPEDIITTLQIMEVLEHKKRSGTDAVINKGRVRAWAESHNVNLNNPIDTDGFIRATKGAGVTDEGSDDVDADEMEE